MTTIVVVPAALMSLVLFNPWRADDASTTTTAIPTIGPATEAPVHRSEKPARQAARTPTSTPLPPETITPTSSVDPTSTVLPTTAPTTDTVVVVYKNCAAVRAAGKAPLRRGNPGYSRALDRNHDGIACARGD